MLYDAFSPDLQMGYHAIISCILQPYFQSDALIRALEILPVSNGAPRHSKSGISASMSPRCF